MDLLGFLYASYYLKLFYIVKLNMQEIGSLNVLFLMALVALNCISVLVRITLFQANKLCLRESLA
jgi:hypothetical protein